MKPIDKDELYQHLSQFLQSKGVELTEGPYKQGIQKSCNLMAEVANATGETLEKARVQLDRTLDQMRQTIHEKTAPKPATGQPSSAQPAPPAAAVKPQPAKKPAKPAPKPAAKAPGKKPAKTGAKK